MLPATCRFSGRLCADDALDGTWPEWNMQRSVKMITKMTWQHGETFAMCQVLKGGWQNYIWATKTATYIIHGQCQSLKGNPAKPKELICEGWWAPWRVLSPYSHF